MFKGHISKDFLEMTDMGGESESSGSDSIERMKKRNKDEEDLEEYDLNDESEPMLQEDSLSPKRGQWDVFVNRSWDSTREKDDKKIAEWLRIFKVTTYLVIFLGIVIFLFLSKVSLIIASSNIRAYPQKDLDKVSVFSSSAMRHYFNNSYTINARPTLECYNYSFSYEKFNNDSGTPIVYNVTWPGTFCMLMPYHYNYSLFHPHNMTCIDVDKWHPRHSLSDGEKFNHTLKSQNFIATPCISVHFRWMWAVFLMICIPYAIIFCRCFWKVCFRTIKSPTGKAIIAILVVDGLHAAGLSYMFFYIVPGLNDSIQAVILLTGVGFVPSCLALTNRPKGFVDDSSASFYGLRMTSLVILNIVAAGLQLSVGIVMTWKEYASQDPAIYCAIVPCLFCISLRWWENYNGDMSSPLSGIPILAKLASEIKRSRTKLQLLSSFFKILVSFATLILSAYLLKEKISPGDRNHWYSVLWMQDIKCSNRSSPGSNDAIYEMDEGIFTNNWISMWTLNVCSGLIVYFLSCVAAKIQIQRVSFAIPMFISVPLTVAFMISGCEIWNNNPCDLTSSLYNATYFYRCYPDGALGQITDLYIFFPFWWISLLWVTRHMWFPNSEKLAKTDKIFVLPLYDGTLLGESIMMNRNRNDRVTNRREKLIKESKLPQTNIHDRAELGEGATGESLGGTRRFLETNEVREILTMDTTPMIYICATMWHENRQEMIQMLKSIFRLDKDQAARTNAYHLNIIDPDYYNFEAHIFFDNSMNAHDEDNPEYTVNDYVHLLVSVLSEAALGEHGISASVNDPVKYPTPYGGRLEWTLPGENKLIVHLKDNAKIRNKKRWSQVMYMYYFLGFKLSSDPSLTDDLKVTRSRNTYLLALDGDVDFQPIALILLIDLMKRQEKVGAVCGRIHPIGSGPMVWYQEFEYAVGHWLQKAAEHVMGCVLCSPGCFSLFRGSAIMDENVMKTYTKLATEPRHHIQYDQGEDRWLCTLLLQQGHRVEYCAASDSFTYCPENFNEFFNQRRRWMPSTMSNILDLIESWKHTRSVNENISSIYIIYQAAILLTSLLSPGIIYLMMVGALTESLQNFLPHNSFGWISFLNALPLIVFAILCFKASSEVQLWFARFMAGVYIIIQLLVLIGTAVTMYNNYVCHSTTIFFLGLTTIFVISGLLHPQELHCLIKGIFYYLSIPTMYMMLMIYAILNLHVISWGTREVKKTAKEMEEEEARIQAAELKKKEQEAKMKGIVFDVMAQIKKITPTIDPKRDYCNCTRTLCNVICCSKPDHPPNEERLLDVESRIDHLEERWKIEAVKKRTKQPYQPPIVDLSRGSLYDQEPQSDERKGTLRRQVSNLSEEPDYDPESAPDYDATSCYEGHDIVRDEMVNPSWIEDRKLGHGPRCSIPPDEVIFFQELVKKYLYPLLKDREAEEKSADELKDFRNKIALGFIFANFAFIVVTLVAQANASTVYVPWPCPAKDIKGKDNLSKLGDHTSKVDLSGIIFLVVFGICLIIQFIAMLIHRLGTFMHLMSTTLLCSKKGDDDQADPKDMVGLAKVLGDLVVEDDDEDNDNPDYDDSGDDGYSGSDEIKAGGFETYIKGAQRENVKTYGQAFIKRLKQLEELRDERLPKDKGFKAASKHPSTKAALMTVRRRIDTIRQARRHNGSVFASNIPQRNANYYEGPYQPPLGRNSLADGAGEPSRKGFFQQHSRYNTGQNRFHSTASPSIRSSDTSDRRFQF